MAGPDQERVFYNCCDAPEFSVAISSNSVSQINMLLGKVQTNPRDCHHGCCLFPKRRLRPLYTYPIEERDGLPRYRPFFNTAIIFPDAEQLFELVPAHRFRTQVACAQARRGSRAGCICMARSGCDGMAPRFTWCKSYPYQHYADIICSTQAFDVVIM